MPAPKGNIGLAAKTLAVWRKDVRCEFRTRYAVNAIILFGITTLTVVSFAVGQMSLAPAAHASLLWIIIFFSGMSGLAQAFIREEEAKTSMALRLVADPTAVYLGKLLFNLALLFLLLVVIAPLFAVLTDVIVYHIGLLILLLLLGGIGLAAATTLVGAIISKSGVKGALFAVLSFPILLPLLIGAIEGTKVAFTPGGGMAEASVQIQLLVGYTVVMVTASLMLFGFVWEE